MSVSLLLAIAVAGAAGAVLRDGVLRRGGVPGSAPRARRVAVVNLAGAVLLAVLQVLPVGADVRTVLGIGFCGSLTTFSTWMVEAVLRAEAEGRWGAILLLDVGAQLAVGVLLVATMLRMG